MRRLLLNMAVLVGYLLSLLGCSAYSDFPVDPSAVGQKLNSVERVYTGTNIFFYGRFCGPDWPKINEKNPTKALAILESIEPVDSLDAVCKRHDICYSVKHYFLQECDDAFMREMNSLKANKNCKAYGALLNYAIWSKFSYKPIPPRPGELTLFGWRELQMHGNPLATPLGLSFAEFEFGHNGWTKPAPGTC